MIQFNLLPDVKLEYLRTKRIQRFVVFASIVICIAAIIITGLIASNVYVLQRQHIGNLDDDIEQNVNEIQQIEDIDQILTVQNQLNTITDLHDEKPVVTRLFDYVAILTPLEITVNELNIDFDNDVLEISGQAATLEDINRYVDTLKFANFTLDYSDEESEFTDNDDQITENAFLGVELRDFTRNIEGASFEIRAAYDEIIFDGLEEIEISIPSRITTHFDLDADEDLFTLPVEDLEEDTDE